MSLGTLLLRADASTVIGTGHVMRCLALAQAWQDEGGKVVVAMAESTPAIEERLRQEALRVAHLDARPGSAEDVAGTTRLAQEHSSAWLVLDGYGFGSEYQLAVKSSGVRLLVIDDSGHAERYSADLILNQNAHAGAELYSGRAGRPRLLLGPRYAMLRRQFVSWREWRRKIPPVGHRVLVTMGGSDPDNCTLRVIQALETVTGGALEVLVVAGGSNPYLEELERAVGRSRHQARLVHNTDNMPELMAWADAAISGAGTTCWEMCLLGLPALVVDLAPNQVPVARCLDQLGVACHLGNSDNCAPDVIAAGLSALLRAQEVRQRMSDAGRKLVDGKGASRVCAAMMASEPRLRPATEADCRLLWEWVNEAGVRASSFSQTQVGWEEHSRWFQAKFADQRCLILIAEDMHGRPVGQVRFEQQPGGEAEIDVSVASESRGAGYGSLLIDAAVGEFFRATTVKKVNAFIKPDNHSSIHAFEKAGFQRVGEKTVRGNRAVHYCRQAEEKKLVEGNAS